LEEEKGFLPQAYSKAILKPQTADPKDSKFLRKGAWRSEVRGRGQRQEFEKVRKKLTF